jgi:hypothetical protein
MDQVEAQSHQGDLNQQRHAQAWIPEIAVFVHLLSPNSGNEHNHEEDLFGLWLRQMQSNNKPKFSTPSNPYYLL